jgi:hypothetical protein
MQSPVVTPWMTAAEHWYPTGQAEMHADFSGVAAAVF